MKLAAWAVECEGEQSHEVLLLAKIEFVAHANFTCGIYDYIPEAVGPVQFAKKKYFNLGACFFFTAIHPGRKYLSVVDSENILVVKIIQDVPEMLVFDLTRVAMNNHHAGVFTFFGGVLGDKIKRQVETKLRKLHVYKSGL